MANRLDRLATLTYATEPASRAEAQGHLRRFFERYQARLGRRPLLAVFEFGGTTGRLHIHLAINHFVPKQLLAELWGHGWVDIRRFKGKGPRWTLRDLARYLAKYIGKDAEGEADGDPRKRHAGQHRYMVTQGWAPRRYRLWFRRVGEAYERMLGLYGRPDGEFPFGDWQADMVFGVWYSFPSECLHPNRPP